jgi:two-component system phosphate regulon response regulator PhoB
MRAEPNAASGKKPSRAKILVVDDDPMTCRLLAAQLEMEGYTCTALSDAQEAWKAIPAESPGLILLDFHLGNRGGLELLRNIRSHHDYRTVPVIVMSALDYHHESELAGADDFVLKPFSVDALLAAVQAVLKRQEHRE